MDSRGRTDTTPGRDSSRAVSQAMLSMTLRSVAVLVVLTVPVATGLGAVDEAPTADRQQHERTSVWEASYSERYLGCVASALWPAEELPVAVVVRTPDGSVNRVALDPQRRSLDEVPPGSTVIGACR